MEGGRGHYRPPVGLPNGEESRGRWRGLIVSIAIHALVLLLLFTSAVLTGLIRVDTHRGIPSILLRGFGSRPMQERVGWVALPAPEPPTEHAAPAVPTHPAPPQHPADLVRPAEPKAQPAAPAPADTTRQPSTSPRTPGLDGTGTGEAGDAAGQSATGSGATAGRSGITRGVTTGKEPATYVDLPAVGLDPPKRVLPFHLIAMFEIDARGASRILSLTPTRDGDFNRRIRGELLEIRWRPALLPDGTAVTDTVQVALDFE